MEDRDLCIEIIELRSYALAKRAVEQATDNNQIVPTPMVTMVWDIQNDILQEINVARKAAAEAKAAEGPKRIPRRHQRNGVNGA